MRVFWLGMHKILTATELPRLRSMGYEVFNPPYLSSVYDQSANLDWDKRQPTSLPPDVFEKLSRYNFFYNQVTPEIAELLNAYFDAVIVTINPQWFAAIARVFRKKLIYRTYGQTYQVCAHLVGERVWTSLLENPDFHFVPFAEETIIGEHRWLTDRSTIVPYSLPFDVYEYEDTWASRTHSEEVMVSVPNLDHPYYANMYNHLNVHFPGAFLRMYGVQARVVDDMRVAGTIPRRNLLQSYQRAAGYFYPYYDFNVCYLPPIEMMTIGGPVVYAQNSLLHRFTKGNSPGLARGIEEQRRCIERLRRHDQVYAQELCASQKEIVAKYHPDHVYPVFESTFRRLLDEPGTHTVCSFSEHTLGKLNVEPSPPEVWLFCHWPGQMIHEHPETGSLFALDGISRVITKVIDALLVESSYILVATCYAYQASVMASYYISALKSGRMRLYVLDPQNLLPEAETKGTELDWAEVFSFIYRRQFSPASPEEAKAGTAAQHMAGRMRLTEVLNDNPGVAAVFVPHYYHFAEAVKINHSIVFYLPDFMPHFYPGVAFEGDLKRDEENATIGRRIAERAKVVMTNSHFTKSYLPASVLQVKDERIRVIPMPLLSGALPSVSVEDRSHLRGLLGDKQFLFYPTANRPNKELGFLLQLFNELKVEHKGLRLALTCTLSDYKPVEEKARRLGLRFEGDPAHCDIVLFPGAHEGTVRWLYENAVALCFTSTMEGNFPPQIIEALHYDTPIVATKLPQISEILGEDADYLLLCSPKSAPDFLSALRTLLRNRDVIRERQLHAKRTVFLWNNVLRFRRMALTLFHEAHGILCDSLDLGRPNYYDPEFLPFGLLTRIERVLSKSTSDYDFLYLLYDLVLKSDPEPEAIRNHIQTLAAGQTREQLISEMLTKGTTWCSAWPDELELDQARAWIGERTFVTHT